MWQTIKELSKELCIPERTMHRHATRMVELGEWEFRLRKEPKHLTREFRKRINENHKENHKRSRKVS